MEKAEVDHADIGGRRGATVEDREEAAREEVIEAMRAVLMDGHGVGAGEGDHVKSGVSA